MKAKKVLIMGGAGYIGSVLSPYLQAKGYDITVADACWFGNFLPDKIRLLTGDLFDLKQQDLASYDSIIFLAGLSNDPMAEFSPKSNFILNTALPSYIGFMAREAGVKQLLFASSCSVYGYTLNKTYTEEDPAICNYPYGVSKLQGERSLLALAEENFQVLCIRQGTVCGYSPRMRLDLAMNTMFKNALLLGEITLSNHRIWRPILALEDLCEAYHLALNYEDSFAEVFNISSLNATVGELAKSVADVVENRTGTKVKVHNKNQQDYRNYKVSTEKAQQLLKYEAKKTEKDIIENLFQNLDHFNDFEEPSYYNIQVFKQLVSKQVIEI
ncbi:MAG: SDR family oxidoreductase [Bacteroidia bacterium]|nr:SDR family oxidoreductase [Bacteroidia bacterium]